MTIINYSTGLYSIPESAKLLANTPPLTNGNKVNYPRLRYWISTSVPHIESPIYPTRKRLVSFVNLISMRMVAVLRSRGVKLKEIKTTETWLEKEFGIVYPLASKGLWTCDSHIYIKFKENLLAASKYGQKAMDFIRDWLSEVELDMTFDMDDVANSWTPYQGISINPIIQFGEPCISGTRIPTSSIWSNRIAGDSPETIAKAHDIDGALVVNAIDWEKRLVAT